MIFTADIFALGALGLTFYGLSAICGKADKGLGFLRYTFIPLIALGLLYLGLVLPSYFEPILKGSSFWAGILISFFFALKMIRSGMRNRGMIQPFILDSSSTIFLTSIVGGMELFLAGLSIGFLSNSDITWFLLPAAFFFIPGGIFKREGLIKVAGGILLLCAAILYWIS